MGVFDTRARICLFISFEFTEVMFEIDAESSFALLVALLVTTS